MPTDRRDVLQEKVKRRHWRNSIFDVRATVRNVPCATYAPLLCDDHAGNRTPQKWRGRKVSSLQRRNKARKLASRPDIEPLAQEAFCFFIRIHRIALFGRKAASESARLSQHGGSLRDERVMIEISDGC
jgi:hypothetical protein